MRLQGTLTYNSALIDTDFMEKLNLPERIEDLLGDEAEAIDIASRTMLSYLQQHDYQLVITPLAESITSLLGENSNGSLGERTLRLTDPLGGSPIGIRADITAQVSRIDRQHFGTGVTRMCYYGPTIYSRPVKPWLSREQLQIGAELFGDASLTASSEIIMLALESLAKVQVAELTVAVCHTALAEQLLCDVNPVIAQKTKQALAKRDQAAIFEMQDNLGGNSELITKLIGMQGERDQLKQWRLCFPGDKTISQIFAELDGFCAVLEQTQRSYTIDLASAGGYQYHNGIAFAILSGETAIAQGGRYGTASRPATGFSANLRAMLSRLPKPAPARYFVSKRAYTEASWRAAVSDLLSQGWRCVLVDDSLEAAQGYTHHLVQENGRWQLVDCS